MRFSTKAIHIGQDPEPVTGAIIPPIFQTSTFAIENPSAPKGYEYTRHNNPNYTNLEATLSALENGYYATVFSSGMGGASALGMLLSSGDRVIALKEVYGGTYRFFDMMQKFGVTFEVIDDEDQEKVKQALKPPTKMLIFETPTNPLLGIIDIEHMVTLAKEQGLLVAVDNTFASPFFQNPLDFGVDVVWHSTTKYLGGHSDIIGGALVTKNQNLKERLDLARMTLGVSPSPFDAWLTSRGVKTMALRMIQHEKNAMACATFLQSHPKVIRVNYPGLPSHPRHEIAKKQMKGFSGMFSVVFDLSLEETIQLVSSFRFFSLAMSLGGVESLVNHSASMSHVAIPKQEREKMGITDSLVRFSAGIENTEDLLEDLEQALASL